MSEEEIIDYQISAIIGHRPTWKSGTNPQANYFSSLQRMMVVLLTTLLIYLKKKKHLNTKDSLK